MTIKSRIHYFIIRKVAAVTWPFLSAMFKVIHGNMTRGSINDVKSKVVIVLASEIYMKNGYTGRGVDMVESLSFWASEQLGTNNIRVVSELSEDFNFSKDSVVLISNDWLAMERLWHKNFRKIRSLSSILRKNQISPFVFLSDSFDLETLIPASILVAVNDGKTVIQQNTYKECTSIGMINPIAPVIWTIPKGTLIRSRLPISWDERDEIVFYAQSGDNHRIQITKLIAHELKSLGWQISPTVSNQLSWPEYVQNLQKGKIVITTNLLQEQYYTSMPNYLRRRLPSTTITHRVWEAFILELLLITNPTNALLELGFVPGEHFLDLTKVIDKKNSISKYFLCADLNKIAKSGRKQLLEVLKNSEFILKENLENIE